MTSNRASTSDMPSSPMFTYATTYTVPRSLPMLSSSFTPFYPQSQQQNYHSQLDAPGNHDASCYASPQEFNDVPKSHVYEWSHPREFYNQQCYTGSGSDPYKACWFANNGNVWGGGGTWQSGNPLSEKYVYADDELDDTAYLPVDSLSYYAESPGMEQDFYACSTSNTAFVAAVYPDPGATSHNVPQSGAELQQISCFSKVKENLCPSLKNSFIQDQAVPYCASRKEGPTKSMSSEIPNAFSSCKPDARPFSMQVSSKMCSSFGITSPTVEPKMKQATTNMTENRGAQTDSSKLFKESCCSSGDEHGLRESVELKHSIQATLNSTSILESLKGSNLDALTMSTSTEVNQKEAHNSNNMAPQSSSSQLLSTSGQCAGMMLPKHIHAQSRHCSIIENEPIEQRNMGSLLSRPSSLITGMEGKTCVEAIDHEGKMGSSYLLPGDAWMYLNGPQLLVKCIHNLSKVLLSSQSGTSSNILDPNDCFAVENTIYILSQRLYQSSINEENFCQDQNCHQLQDAEQGLNISDNKVNEEAGRELLQQKKSFLLEGMKHKVKAISPNGVLENRALDGSSKLTSSTCVEGDKRAEQSSFVKKEFKKPLEDLLMLQCNFAKLQEEVAYERAESDATVTTYKTLWSEAQEALNVSRLEIEKLRAELAGLQRDFTNLKHSEGLGGLGADLKLTKHDMKTTCNNSGGLHENLLDVKTGSSQHFTTQNIYREASSKKTFPACSEVYFVPESISSYGEDLSSFGKGEGTTLSHNNQNGKRSEISAMEPLVKHVGGTNIQDEVKQRLSLLLARQCLDLNKMDADRDVDLPSSLSTSLEASSNLPREGEALPPDKKGNCLIWSATSYMTNVNKKIGGAKADLSCQMMPAFDANYGDRSLVQTRSNSRNTEGMDFEDVNVSTFQEDEIEIICLKPGVAESRFTCLKEEPDWEHVVVNGLDNHKTNR